MSSNCMEGSTDKSNPTTFCYTIVNDSGVTLMCGESDSEGPPNDPNAEILGFDGFEAVFDVPPRIGAKSEITHSYFLRDSKRSFVGGLVTIWAQSAGKRIYIAVNEFVQAGTVIVFMPDQVRCAATKSEWMKIIAAVSN